MGAVLSEDREGKKHVSLLREAFLAHNPESEIV